MPISLLDFFFPKRSLTGEEGQWITDREREHLVCHPITVSRKELEEEGILWLDRLVASADYDSSAILRKAIQTFKYQRVGELRTDLGRLLVQASYLSWSSVAPVLCPVPLHWARQHERGFNQAELLATVVARARGCSVRPLLRRVRPTGHQAWREKGERKEAMRDVFQAQGAIPPFIVLVDDIATTGSTLDMCAKVLKHAGAKRVEGLVLAMG